MLRAAGAVLSPAWLLIASHIGATAGPNVAGTVADPASGISVSFAPFDKACATSFVSDGRSVRRFVLRADTTLFVNANTPQRRYLLNDGRTLDVWSPRGYPRAYTICETRPWTLSVSVEGMRPAAAVLLPDSESRPFAEALKAAITAIEGLAEGKPLDASVQVRFLNPFDLQESKTIEVPNGDRSWQVFCISLDEKLCDRLHQRDICLTERPGGSRPGGTGTASVDYSEASDLLVAYRLSSHDRRIVPLAPDR